MGKILPSPILRKRLDTAISNLLPLFNVTNKELKGFQEYGIRRVLKNKEYNAHSKIIPFYHPGDIVIYFPLRSRDHGYKYSTFCEDAIYHEASHYIHHMLTPFQHKKWLNILKKNPKAQIPGKRNLVELVACYSPFILNSTPKELLEENENYEIYKKYGPSFLPKLARISLSEAISLNIIKI